MNGSFRPRAGFSLLEVVIVIAVIGVLIGIVTVPFATFRKHQALENTTNGVVAVLNDARAKTFAAYNNTTYSVHLEADRAVLFTGTTYSATAATNEVYEYEYPVTAIWSMSAPTVSFDRLKGSTASYGTITLQLPDGTTRLVTITALGTVARN